MLLQLLAFTNELFFDLFAAFAVTPLFDRVEKQELAAWARQSEDGLEVQFTLFVGKAVIAAAIHKSFERFIPVTDDVGDFEPKAL